MNFLRRTQEIGGNTVTKGGSVSNYLPILEHRVESLQSHDTHGYPELTKPPLCQKGFYAFFIPHE